MESAVPMLPFLLFPVAFAALWTGVTALMGWMSGWYALMARYPDRVEAPLLKLTWQSGAMGVGVNYRNILTLAACPSGLRVSVWKFFGLWSQPFFVPWEAIKLRRAKMLFVEVAELSFGAPENGKLALRADVADRLAAAAGKRWPQAKR